MPWALKVQERGGAKPAYPQPSQQEMAFHLAEQSVIWGQLTAGRGGVSLGAALFLQTLQRSCLIHCRADVLPLVQVRTELQGGGEAKGGWD